MKLRSIAPVTPLVLIIVTACGQGGTPTVEDVPDIMAEAAGTKEVPKWGDSDSRRAVRTSFKTLLYFDSVHEAEVRRRFQTPELRHYLMLSDSYVGGDFPRRIATLLREVQYANRNYIQQVASFPSVLSDQLARTDLSSPERDALQAEMAQAVATRQQPVLDAVAAFDRFVDATARSYEHAARNSGSLQSMRTGLESSDDRVLHGYNMLADEVNRAHEAADSAMRRLPPDQAQRFRRMGITKPVRR